MFTIKKSPLKEEMPCCHSNKRNDILPHPTQVAAKIILDLLFCAQFTTYCFWGCYRFKIRLCATSDNCLLTVWPQMALERSKQQIVLRAGTV